MAQFIDKVVLVTGGASGIGRETAVAFGREGATVVVSDVNEQEGAQTVQLIQEVGGAAAFITADVGQHEQVKGLIAAIVAQHGRLDIAFNNAGVEGAPVRTADVSEDEFDWIMNVNVKGVWLCMKYEIPQMMAQGGGTIVNTASVAGLVGAHSLPVYAASKHAVVGLTKTAALEYAKAGIRVNAICPVFTHTPMVDELIGLEPGLEDKLRKSIPMQRFGEVAEIVDALCWLAQPGAGFVTGLCLPIDGGTMA
ncbi:MAG: SDR family oxidoreductase [Phaeodactylibacter sp.]|nr:SDR family oxidoreductase [Phaeodactylibacter sp.]